MRQAPRVAILINKFTLGGAQFQAVEYAKALRDLGFHPIVFALDTEGPVGDQLQKLGLEFVKVPFLPQMFHSSISGKIQHIYACSKLLRRHRIALAIPFTYYPNLIGILAARLAGVRYRFWNERGMDEEMRISFTEKLSKRMSSHFLSNSSSVKSYLSARTSIEPLAISVIRNVYQPRIAREGRSEWRQRLGLADGEYLLTMIANFFPVKDHHTFLRAAQVLFQQRGDVKIALAGYSPNKSRLLEMKSLAYDLGLCGKVVFCGSVSDIGGLLEATDIGVHCTDMEGSPNAVLDFMLAGLPVVASDIPPVRELIEKVDEHWLTPPKDHLAIVCKLEQLLENPTLRHDLGAANKRFVRANHAPVNLKKDLQVVLQHHTEFKFVNDYLSAVTN